MGEIRKAYNRVIARLRPLLALLTAALLAGAIACETDAGVVAVGLSDEGLIAITYARGGGNPGIGSPAPSNDYALDYSSQEGGLTWRQRDTAREIPDEWLQQGVWRDEYYRQNAVHTPRGSYRIDGGDIQIRTPDGEQQTVYSAAYLQSPFNQWLQAKSIDKVKYTLAPSYGPVSIAYDPPSGNLIAAMGILGVVVGTSNGNWMPVGVGPYNMIDFSGTARVSALFSSISLWAAALTFPLSMIAFALTVVSVARALPVYASVIGYFNPISRPVISLPMTILFALLAATFAAILLVILGTGNMGYPSQEYTEWFCLIVSAVLSMVSVAGSLDSLELSTNGRWGFSLRMLAVTSGAFAAMLVFVLLPFLVWAWFDDDLIFAGAVSAALCAAVAVGLIRYYWRASRQVIAPQIDRD